MNLIDTGPLVALCDHRDRRHAEARAQLPRILRDGRVTCEAVLVEACFHLPAAAHRERLRAVLDDFRVKTLPEQGAAFQDEVFDWLAKYAEHEPDWADACIAVHAGRDRKLKVWTFDGEFSTIWRRPDGTHIPLSIKDRRPARRRV